MPTKVTMSVLYGATIDRLEFSRNPVTLKRYSTDGTLPARTNASVYLSRKPWILRLATAQNRRGLIPYGWLWLSKTMAAYGGGFGV